MPSLVKGPKIQPSALKKDYLFFRENMLLYLAFDIISSSKLKHLLELRSLKTVRTSAQIMSAKKYPCLFSRQIEAIVYTPHGITFIFQL